MITRKALLPAMLAVALFTSRHAYAGAQYSDGTFADANWMALKIQDTTVGSAATFSAGQLVSVGNPGPCRSNQFNFSYNGTATNQGIVVANLSTNMVYNPSVSGAIVAVNYNIDGNKFSESGGSPSVDVGLLLLQGGHYYGRFPVVPTSSWITTKESTLHASDFTQITATGNGVGTPDFTTNGSTIEFGYLTACSISSGGAQTINANVGADNFSITITNAPIPSFVSEVTQNANSVFTLGGVAPGESITWLVSTNITPSGFNWTTNQVISASGTTATFTFSNSAVTTTNRWFLRAVVQ